MIACARSTPTRPRRCVVSRRRLHLALTTTPLLRMPTMDTRRTPLPRLASIDRAQLSALTHCALHCNRER